MRGWSWDDDEDGIARTARRGVGPIEIFPMYKLIRYNIPVVLERDDDIPGKSHACHAERQVVAYFVGRHTLLAEIRSKEGRTCLLCVGAPAVA
jgi:hypothetical protein